MRWFFAAVALLVMPAAIRAETFDNASVVALVRAGLGNEVLLAKIATMPCSYDLSTAGLLALHDAGVAPVVLAQMVRRCSETVLAEPATHLSDPAGRPVAGIYLIGSGAEPGTLLRPAATVGVKHTGNGSLLFPRRATLTVAQPHAQVSTAGPRPVFQFYFDPMDDKVNTFGTAATEAAQSPNEFSLVRFRIDRDTRQLVIGRDQPFTNVEGLDPKVALPFAIEPAGPGHFRVAVPSDLAAGEYGFVLVGENSRGRSYYRIFDFAVPASSGR